MQIDTHTETSPAPSRFVDFVHRLGEKKGEALQRKIETREELIRQSEQQHEQALAKLRGEREAALSVQEKLSSLELDVEKVSDEIVLAESTRSQYEAQLANLEGLLLDGWGNSTVFENFGGPNYREVSALRAALEDFPRIKAHLAGKLLRAQSALSEFERSL